MRGLTDTVAAALDRRLDAASSSPLAVGVSGGGDSLALLIMTLEWARPRGRRVIALTVDHGLNPDSAAWTMRAQDCARRLGAEAVALAWTGEKPLGGLPAAARDARHRLLADKARDLGAHVLLLGHTADDLAEAAAMRAEGSSVGDPREWAPSPVWPEGRGVFLLRPLLRVGRGDLRDFLRQRNEAWLDDPANDDLTYARARARRSAPSVTARGAAPPPPPRRRGEQVSTHLPSARPTEGTQLTLARAELTTRTLAAACLCAAGHDRPPRRAKVEGLIERLRASGPLVATLAGARLVADDEIVRVTREAGRSGLPALALPVGKAVAWDGRYEIQARTTGLSVRALGGLAPRLSLLQQALLKKIPAPARSTLPVLVDAGGTVSCPILAEDRRVRIVPLILARFEAACGVVTREGDGGEAARGEIERGVLSWGRM